MLKIRALNREASSDEDFPVIRREAQEEIALEEYNKALRLQASGELDEAEKILKTLIEENIPQLENNGGLPHSMSTIKYSCYLNIGNINIKKGDSVNAIENYLKASELDTTDVSLWYKIGCLAIKINRFRQATYALAKGLECSENHWPCLDQLISLLFAMKDTINCLLFIGRALNLDPDYTKGLVLRSQIYKDNPATLEYYQLYNPDYIWEPSLDVEIDEKDRQRILENVQILCDKITEAEKALGPKPLQTIPLPKALEDFTWISLGKTVTHLHQYITDNNMSHFTMVDISQCMSQEKESVKTEEKEDVPMKSPEEVVQEIEKVEVVEAQNPPPIEEEKMEVDDIPERRPSQNSETNNDGQENTPIQTDNDEEQATEQDGEDQEENSDNKSEKNKSLTKSNKRKRDLLSDLQIWGWHSKRKSGKKGKTEKDYTVEDALNRILPKTLLKHKLEEKYNPFEDSMNTMDIYNMYVSENRHVNILSPIHSPKSANLEEYFGTDREKDDVKSLWLKERTHYDAVLLIKDFVVELSKCWHIKWPKELIQLYIEAYNMYREHYDHPQPFSGDSTFEEMREDALVTLLYGELINFSSSKTETRSIHVTSLAFLQIISGWQDDWKDEYVSFFVRVYWLRCRMFRKEGNNDLAVQSLELIKEVIEEEEKNSEEKYFLYLPNCFKCGLITSEITAQVLKHLDLLSSLNCLEEFFNNERYEEVAEIVKLSFSSGSHLTSGKLGRPAEIGMLLHSLWYTDLKECFIWTEECLCEALIHFLKPTTNADKWQKVVEKCLAFFHEIIKMETVIVVDSLSPEKRARLVESLTKIICKQLNNDSNRIPTGTATPWILLHYILNREEHREQANKRISHVKRDRNENQDLQNTEELPPSIAILFSAHEFLGPKGWCLANGGELLHFILDTILDRLDTPIFEPLREKIDIHIEQALFCLYQHPSKKNKISRHLADHNVDPLSLTWERAFQLYEFYGPDCLPEFNSYKNASITLDLEQLLQRIIALVPKECDPQPHLQQVSDFINGKSDKLPDPLDFPNKVRSIYYLIGDYYFKQREFTRCIKYFMMDLCISPLRLDSWACLGLSYLSQLESKLNYCKKIKSETEFLDKAKCAQICFKQALEIAKDHIMLWIEFGSFEYMVHSFCSRVMKTESDRLSIEKFEYLEEQKNNYLESSGRSFEKAIELYQPDESEADERWLQYYILGKVAEKKQKEPTEYLQFYATASKLLHENNALYPDKINYHNPQHLSVEALEMHYRMNASILKYLELHENKDIPNSIGSFFKQKLDQSYFPKKSLVKETTYPQSTTAATTTATTTTNTTTAKPDDLSIKTSKNSDDISKEVKKCIDDIISKVEEMIKGQTDKPVEKVDEEMDVSVAETTDVIILSDSEEEKSKLNDSTQIQPTIQEKKDFQELLDKMMEETMKKTEEQVSDSDASTASKQVCDGRSEDLKSDRSKAKSESETDDLRTSVDDDSSSSQSSSSSSSSSSNSDSDDDSSSSSSSSSSEASNENMSTGDILSLIDRCVVGLEQCVIRLPQNYKALYRLAHLYFNYKAKRDMNKCRQLLLGEYTCKGGITITGLFSDRKNHNFFNGIWRIPSSEIDRPGSLAAHMSRCITLLLQVLHATNDNKTLLDLYLHFRRTPDPDKIYIKDSERLQFADQAMAMCVQSYRSQMQNINSMSDTAIQKLLQDIYRSLQRIQKAEPSKETTFSGMLTEIYKKWKKDKIGDSSNVLDLATKFCQQNRLVEKQKRQLQKQTAVLRGPGVPPAPVLPAPATVNPTAQPPLKRPGMGRPRGRPPLPKVPGQPGPGRPRGRTSSVPTSGYSWQKSLYDQNTYSYLKHYQEELIKQYSQSLNLSQLTQLSQYLTQQNQLTQFAQSQLANQFLASQAALLSNPALLKQMSTSQFLNPKSQQQQSTTSDSNKAASSSSSQSLKRKTPDVVSSTAELLKNYNMGQMSPKTTTASKKNLPHTITSSSQASKPKTPTPSSTPPTTSSSANFNINLPLSTSVSVQQATSKAEKIPTHTMNPIPPPIITCSAKTMFTSSSFKSNYTSGTNYPPAEIGKYTKPRVTTQTVPSMSIFKEPSVKAHSIHKTSVEKTTNILMKDRPSISITPVITSGGPSTFLTPPIQTSPGKTLQEKLADKQKQLSSKQQLPRIEAEIKELSAPAIKKLNIPSIPASLSVSRAHTPPQHNPPIKFPLDSGLSISQVPVTQTFRAKDISSLTQSSYKSSKSLKDVNLPPNTPLSLSMNKKPKPKPKPPDDDVILID